VKRAAILLGALGVGVFFANRAALALPGPDNFDIGTADDPILNDHAELITFVPNTPQTNVFSWENIKHFSKIEFDHPTDGDTTLLIDNSLVLALDELRAATGCPIIISQAKGSIVRYSPGSQHDITGGRLSRAADVFILGCTMREVFDAAKTIPAIGGIGFYPDWNPWPGYHIDTRPRKTDGTLATWMGRKTITGQTYVGIDWGLLNSLGQIA